MLAQLEFELSRVKLVYAVHEEHARFVRDLSGTLWTSFDVELVTTGAVLTSDKLRRLAPTLGDLPIFDAVGAEIKAFLDSLPLMRNLKSDALRPRHWDALKEVW